jgi:hypothetical protein
MIFCLLKEKRLFTRTLVEALNHRSVGRPWAEALNGKPATDIWLARQLRPYGIKSKTIWIGEQQAKGFQEEDFLDVCRRYVARSDYAALRAEWTAERKPEPTESEQNAAPPTSPPAAQAA